MTAELEVKAAESIVVRPGDTLVLRTGGDLTEEDADRILDAVRKNLPGVVVLVLGFDGEMAVYRPEDTL